MVQVSGPFVVAAAFCRDIIEQADGDTTLVGVTNTTVAETDENGEHSVYVTMFLSIRAGNLRGKHEVVVRPLDPSGSPAFPPGAFPVAFEGGASGAEVQVRVGFDVEQEGLYWFDVLLDGEELLTRTPLTVRFGPDSNEHPAGDPSP